MIRIMGKLEMISRCASHFRMKRVNIPDLGPGQHRYVIRICKNPGITQDALARGLEINKSNVTRTLSCLEENGYVTRIPCASDKRSIEVYPTEKMLQIFPLICQAFDDWNAYLTAEMSEEELDALQQSLDRIMKRALVYAEGEGDK